MSIQLFVGAAAIRESVAALDNAAPVALPFLWQGQPHTAASIAHAERAARDLAAAIKEMRRKLVAVDRAAAGGAGGEP